MGARKGASVGPPSTISSTALMYDKSSEARKSTAISTREMECGTSGIEHIGAVRSVSIQPGLNWPRHDQGKGSLFVAQKSLLTAKKLPVKGRKLPVNRSYSQAAVLFRDFGSR